jgi:hypothetical protein
MSDLPGAGHNRLAALAANIRALHAGVCRSAEQAARDAIEAGKLLIEAKALLKHGEWEPWLRDNVAIPPRTARRDVALARSGLEPAAVADLGMNAAERSIAIDRLRVARIRRHTRKGWQAFVEAGREFGAIRDEIGEEQFRAWVPVKTGFDADEALFMAEIAHVTDAGGDVGALLARDDAPKYLTLPASSLDAVRARLGLVEAPPA